MAMEHFDEKIVPIIRYRAQQQQQQICGGAVGAPTMTSPTRAFGGIDLYRGAKMAASIVVGAAPSTCGGVGGGAQSSASTSLHDLFPPSSTPPSSGGASPTAIAGSNPPTSLLPQVPMK